jgi:integrase
LSEIDQYVDERKAEKTSKGTLTRNGTINRELAIVVSSLRLMRPEPRVLHTKKLNEEDGVRQGIVSEEDYRVFLRELEGYQKPVWCFAYYVGVRQGQLLKLRREWAREWQATGIICVPGRYKGERITKNAKPHHIPIYSAEMREFLKIAWETGDPACSYLFQRDGKRISKNMFYSALKRIAIRIGRPTILFHDLRRTAVTNMIRAGIPPEEAMAVSGHLDPSIFKRYNIISTAESQDKVRRAGQKMAAWHEKKQKEVTDLADIMRTESDFDAPDSEIARKPN